jgi:hypothetical protein
MTRLNTRLRVLATRNAPELCLNHVPLITEGAGNAGSTIAPAALCANEKAHKQSHHRYAETTRHSLRDGFTVCFVLSPVTGLFCHRRFTGLIPRNLTPASGRQDHTTSPSALASFVFDASASIASRTQRS